MESRVRTFCLAGLLVSFVAVALPASSGAFVFWASNNAANPIGRANLDGSGANRDFPARHGHFPHRQSPSTALMSTGPTAPSPAATSSVPISTAAKSSRTFPGAQAVRGITVAGSFIYWSSGTCVGRANLNGSGAENCFTGDGEGTNQVAVGGNRIYGQTETSATSPAPTCRVKTSKRKKFTKANPGTDSPPAPTASISPMDCTGSPSGATTEKS